MKNNILAIFFATLLMLFAACKKETVVASAPTQKSATVGLNFTNTVDGAPVTLGALNYTNAAFNKYSVTLLRYYVSHIELLTANGAVYAANNYNLVDAAAATQNVVTLEKVPAADYVSLRFHIGIDSARNHTGLQDGFLDPSYGMLWTWNTGYIFFKHEGQFKDSSNTTRALRLHMGTDNAFVTVAIPVNLAVSDSDRKLDVQFNLNAAYNGAGIIDFNTDNNRQSQSVADAKWIGQMKENLGGAFTATVKQ